MKKILLIAMAILITASVYAANIKIGFIDTEKILTEYKDAIEVKNRMMKEQKVWKDELMAIDGQIEKLVNDNKKIMITQKKKAENEQKIRELQEKGQNRYREIFGEAGVAAQLSRDLLAPIYEKIRAAIAEISKKGKFTYVVDINAEHVLYIDKTYDITKEVVDYLNKLK